MSLTRNTLFALLMALEADLRRAVCVRVSSDSLLTPDEAARAKLRWLAERNRGDATPSAADLIDYVDLTELLDIVNRHAAALCDGGALSPAHLRAAVGPLRELAAIRNRVCHARPLEPDDYSTTLATLERLGEKTESCIEFSESRQTWLRLHEDPSFPLVLAIPEFWKADLRGIPNNLPVPDYDDTGFIGRKSDREQLLRLLRGARSVITVTGEGGVGKTSLALQCLYDLATDREPQFDRILWFTLKTTVLTTSGIRTIAGAMTSASAVLAGTAATGGSVPEDASFAELLPSVIEFMTHSRVLLAVDNLESIDRDALRPLFLELPNRSKILLTSRYGIGEFETLYGLSGMDKPDAVRLLRSTARLLNATELYRRDDGYLEAICEKLFFNPLAVRWFVQSFSEGRSGADLLERQRNLSEVLDFCFHTLYESLSEEHRSYLRALVAIGKPLSEVQLALLTGVRDIEQVKVSLRYLYSSNLLRRTTDEWSNGLSNLWTTSEFARAYVSNRDKSLLGHRPRLVKTYRILMKSRDETRAALSMNPFRQRAFRVRTTDEATVTAVLQVALNELGAHRFRAAQDHVENARRLLPGYFEVWRVSAQVRAAAGDAMGANQDFERALELADGQSEALMVHYANFLAVHDDYDTAFEILRSAAGRASADPRLVACYARMAARTGEVPDSLEAFGRVRPHLLELGGSERLYAVTHHCEALVQAVDIDLQRRLPAKAFAHVVTGLQVAATCGDTPTDAKFMSAVQRIVDLGCRLVSRTSSSEDWETLHRNLVPLRHFVQLRGPHHPGLDALAANSPQIASSPSFLEDFGPAAVRPNVLFGDALIPAPGVDYTFIKSDDGTDYFVHRSEVDPLEWSRLGTAGHSRVRFNAGAGRDGRPQARSALVIRLDDD